MRPLRFLAVFCLTALAGFAVEVIPWVNQNVVAQIIAAQTWISGALIHAGGGVADIAGTVIRHPVNLFAIQISNGCSGIEVAILLAAGMLAFPASWRERALGWVAGTSAIMSLNIVRIISLYYLGQYSSEWFDWAHTYAWDLLIMVDGLIVFLLWIRCLPPLKGQHEASAGI